MSQSWRFLAFEVGIVSCKQEVLEALSIAKNIASNPLTFRVNEIEESIVAYCRGPYCVLSFEAVAVLRAMGYQAHRLVDGFPEWKAAGFEVELPA
jgi:ArsR family transcriptional regulator